jgi:hypothetical protein
MICPNFCPNARIRMADSTDLTPCLSLFAMNPGEIQEERWEMVQGVLVDAYTRRLFDDETQFTRNGPIVTGVLIKNMNAALFQQVQLDYLEYLEYQRKSLEGAEEERESENKCVKPAESPAESPADLADLVEKIKL